LLVKGLPICGNSGIAVDRHFLILDLTLSITSTAAFAKQLDTLVREIAGDTEDAITLERARAVAQVELELARVRRAKVALIERASAFGELDPPELTAAGCNRLLNAALRGRDFEFIDASATMPSQEPDRSAEAVRRVLPELRKLDLYKRRAAAQRDRAVRGLNGTRKSLNNPRWRA
jgi:hypothetical protein